MIGKLPSIAILLIGLAEFSGIRLSGQSQTTKGLAQKKSTQSAAVINQPLTVVQSAATAAARREARMLRALGHPSEDASNEKKAQFDEHFAAFKSDVEELEDAGVPAAAQKPYTDLLHAWYEAVTAENTARGLELAEEICVTKCDLARAKHQEVEGCVADCHRNADADIRAARDTATEIFEKIDRQTAQLKEPSPRPKK